MKNDKTGIGGRMSDFEIEVISEEPAFKEKPEKSPTEMMLDRVREVLSENSPPFGNPTGVNQFKK